MKEGWQVLVRRWTRTLGNYRYVLLVIAAGAVLLLLPGGETGGQETETREAQEYYFDLEEFEKKLEQTLSQIEGAGEVRVVLALEDGGRQVLARDQERSGESEGAFTTVTVGRGSGTEEVVPLQTLTPDFRGALVVCPGGGESQVRLRLTEAVSAVTGLGSDRISVCAGNTSF